MKTVKGVIRPAQGLRGGFKFDVIHVTPAQYEGDYEVTPKAFEAQTLETDGKLMQDNVTVLEIPYYETSNISGKTVYIG